MNSSHPLICVVDDDDAVRKGIMLVLQSEEYLVEAFNSAQAFLDHKIYSGPCCVILDVKMPGLSGLDLQQILTNRRRTEQIIFISGHADIPLCAQAMKAGAVDFLPKPFTDTDLLEAVHSALKRSYHELNHKTGMAEARNKLTKLTPREFEVLRHVIAGKLNKQIASDLGAAEKTVKIHRGRITEKLRITSVAELVQLALKAGVHPSEQMPTLSTEGWFPEKTPASYMEAGRKILHSSDFSRQRRMDSSR